MGLRHAVVSASAPTSPRGRRPPAPRRHLPPVISSPARAMRKATPSASFGTAPRTSIEPKLCPVHSYSSLETFKPTSIGGAVYIGDLPRPTGNAEAALPAVHAYEPMRSSLSRAGMSAFNRDTNPRRTAEPTSGPTVHSYEPVRSMLSHKGGVISRDTALLRRPLISSTSVHSYAQMRASMVTSATSATFPKAGRKDTSAGSCEVHAYMGPVSTLKQSGATSWGRPYPIEASDRRAPTGHVAKLRAAVTRPVSPSDVEDPLKQSPKQTPITSPVSSPPVSLPTSPRLMEPVCDVEAA